MPFDGTPRPYESPSGAPFDQVLRTSRLLGARSPAAGCNIVRNRETNTAPMERSFPRRAAIHIAQSPRYASCGERTRSQPDAAVPGARHNFVE